MTTNVNTASGKDLRLQLRCHGYSVAGWARANGYARQTVHRALSGINLGKRAREIRTKVENLKG